MDLVLVFGSLIVIFVSLGAMGLSGWRYWVKTKASMPLDEVTPALQDAIRDEIERALAARDGELAELHERIDFAERLLSRPAQAEKEEPR